MEKTETMRWFIFLLSLLICIHVAFASRDGWSSNKNVVFYGTSLWINTITI